MLLSATTATAVTGVTGKKRDIPLSALAAKEDIHFCLFRQCSKYTNGYISELTTV
jgi:hypothetical protein